MIIYWAEERNGGAIYEVKKYFREELDCMLYCADKNDQYRWYIIKYGTVNEKKNIREKFRTIKIEVI